MSDDEPPICYPVNPWPRAIAKVIALTLASLLVIGHVRHAVTNRHPRPRVQPDTRWVGEEEIAQAQCQLLRQKYPCALIEVRELRDGSRRVYAWLHDDRKVWISSGDRYTLHYTSYIDLYLGMAEGVANK